MIQYELALRTRTLPGKEAFVVRNHRAFVQRGCACSHTNMKLLHKYYAEIARERMHRDDHHLIEKQKALLPTFENEEDAESKIDVGVDEDKEL